MERTKLRYNKDNSLAPEICRLSWFLVEVNVEAYEEINSRQKRSFCIIHFVDIVGEDSSNMYINRIVNFKCNHNIVQGKIIMASDDRVHVARLLNTFVEETEEAEIFAIEDEKRVLVQYTKGPNKVVQSVVQQKEICWPDLNFNQKREVFIRDGRLQRVATVLYAHDDAQQVFEELEKLKNRCFETTFDKSDSDIEVDDNVWLLVQYSHGPAVMVYAVVNMKETVWQEKNLYKDVVAYLSDGVTFFQGIIIRKSKNRDLLDEQLRKIKDYSCSLDYPLKLENDSTSQALISTNALSEADTQEENDAAESLRNRIQELESHMYYEATVFANAFEAVDITSGMMNQCLYFLRNALYFH